MIIMIINIKQYSTHGFVFIYINIKNEIGYTTIYVIVAPQTG